MISERSCDTEDWSYDAVYMKSSDAKASKCHLKFSSKMIIFIKLFQQFHLNGNEDYLLIVI